MTEYIQLPPDSTGKKIRHENLTDLYVTELIKPEIGTILTGATSGATGEIVGRHVHEGNFEYYLKSVVGTFTVGENLINGITTYASIVQIFPNIYTQDNILIDSDNPDNSVKIDQRGQLFTRFGEASPTISPMGRLRVSNAKILGGYEYSHVDQSGLFQDKVLTGGSITHDPQTSRTIISTTSSNGSSASRTTNRYHFYQPGNANYIPITLSLSDTGKTNNTRRWGFYDQYNGLFFELQNTTLNVVLRTNTSGTVVEHRIPQSLWNGDKLDGNGISGTNLDLTKANFFWIDYAWLGVGAARFGIVAADGSRWVAHTFENPGEYIHPYMATGSLPIRYENFNSGATSGSSSINAICSAVYSEQQTDYVFWRFSDIERNNVTITTDTHIFSMRPKLEIAAGIPNRTGIYPETLSVFVTGGDIKITIVDNATLTTPSWQACTSLAQYDISGTVVGGDKFKTFYLSSGCHNIDLSVFFETNDEGYHVLADGTDAYNFTLIGTKLSGTTVTISATLGYRELN